jgi:hypothetical protein
VTRGFPHRVIGPGRGTIEAGGGGRAAEQGSGHRDGEQGDRAADRQGQLEAAGQGDVGGLMLAEEGAQAGGSDR